MDEFKVAWVNAPVPLPEYAPQPGKDYDVSDQQVPVRDGTTSRLENAILVLKAHGGGETRLIFLLRHET
jgi:hypothetical protein